MYRKILVLIACLTLVGALGCSKKSGGGSGSDDKKTPAPPPAQTTPQVQTPASTAAVTPASSQTPLKTEYTSLPSGLIVQIPTDDNGYELPDQSEIRMISGNAVVSDFGTAQTVWQQAVKAPSDIIYQNPEAQSPYQGYDSDYYQTSEYYQDINWDYSTDYDTTSPTQSYSYGYKSKIKDKAFWGYRNPTHFCKVEVKMCFYYFARPSFDTGLYTLPETLPLPTSSYTPLPLTPPISVGFILPPLPLLPPLPFLFTPCGCY